MIQWERRRRGIDLLHRSRGQAMVELLIVLPVMGLLMLGAVQFAFIYHAKITLNYAAYEGVRAGTLNHASLKAVRRGFARGLAPLYAYSKIDGRKQQVAAFETARNKVRQEIKQGLVRIERINPTENDFKKFVPRGGEIPNDNLRYRPSGTADGPEKNRKGSIQNANLLHLRFTYWYPLYVPVINTLIFDYFICCNKQEDADNQRTCRWQNDIVCQQDKPRIPITAVSAMRMQSSVENDKGYNCSQLVENHQEAAFLSLSASDSCVQ